jgi:hypothetical protein
VTENVAHKSKETFNLGSYFINFHQQCLAAPQNSQPQSDANAERYNFDKLGGRKR